MKPRVAALIWLLLAGSRPLIGATVRGVILANELGGSPVANVQLSAVEGASPVASRSNGTFVLEFPNKQPGEPVQLIVEKRGMVVVNDFQLQVTLQKGTTTGLTLLLCKAADREEMARRYYRLKSFDAIEQSYLRKIKELEAKNQATEAAREQLRVERDRLREAAQGAAEQLARAKPGEASELYGQAVRLFAEGKIEAALAVLDEEKLKQAVAASMERKAAAEKELHQEAQVYELRGQLLASKFQFEDARKNYQAATLVAPDDPEAHFNLGRFSHALNAFSEAESSYGRALELFRRKGDEGNVVSTLIKLGKVLRDEERIEEAQKASNEALELSRRLARQNPATYLPYLARSLNSLGALHQNQNRIEEARSVYQEALDVHRKVAGQNCATCLSDLAETLSNLGALLSVQRRTDEARKAFDEALAMFRKVAQHDPDALQYVAGTLNNLALLQAATNHGDEARKSYSEALALYRKLARQNPEAFLPDLALTLNSFGAFQGSQKQTEKARQAFDEALEIYQKLAQQNPSAYAPSVALTLNDLGYLDDMENRSEDARQAYDRALEIYRKLARQNPDAYLPDVAQTVINLGMLLNSEERIEEAAKSFEEALAIYEDFAKTNPEVFCEIVASTRRLLDEVHAALPAAARRH